MTVQYPCISKNIFREIHCALMYSPVIICPKACMCLLQAAHGIHCGGAACPLMGHIGPWSFSRGGLWSAALMAGYFSQPLPCRLVQPSLLLPKREGGSKARGDAPRCLHASAPAPWPQRLNTTCGCWGWRWLGLGDMSPGAKVHVVTQHCICKRGGVQAAVERRTPELICSFALSRREQLKISP